MKSPRWYGERPRAGLRVRAKESKLTFLFKLLVHANSCLSLSMAITWSYPIHLYNEVEDPFCFASFIGQRTSRKVMGDVTTIWFGSNIHLWVLFTEEGIVLSSGAGRRISLKTDMFECGN
ncbi:hypothetical protein Droror1_Dr00028133 [Drosera rotundifolia]